MNQQDELGAKIAGLLADGADSLTAEQRERLAAARRQALARHRAVTEKAPALIPEWAGPFSAFTERSVMGVRYVIPFAVLIMGLLGVVHMHKGTVPSEIADIDAGLLTDELPIDAFLDQTLDSWLKRSPR